MQALEATKTPANVDQIVHEIRKHLDSTEKRSGYHGFLACHRLSSASSGFWDRVRWFADAQISMYPVTMYCKFQLPSDEDALRDDWEMVGRDLYQAILQYTITAHGGEPTGAGQDQT